MGVTQLFRVVCLAFVATAFVAPAVAKPTRSRPAVSPPKRLVWSVNTTRPLVGFRPFSASQTGAIIEQDTYNYAVFTFEVNGHVLYNADRNDLVTLAKSAVIGSVNQSVDTLQFVKTSYNEALNLPTYCWRIIDSHAFNVLANTLPQQRTLIVAFDHSVTITTTLPVIPRSRTVCPPPSP